MMKIACLGMALAATTCSGAMAQQRTFHLRTNEPELSKWTVYEITKGEIVSAPAVFNHRRTWGHVPSITIPFTNCDGYWYTKRDFHIPVGATNLSLNITGLGVDDRAVLTRISHGAHYSA
jgi:hypothetical protein